MATHITFDEARTILKKMRDEQVRDGDMVVKLWEGFLIHHSHKLADELWMVYEQVCIAALDCRRLDLAEECIEALQYKFPDSMRVKRLEGLFYEADGRYNEADKLYTEIIEKDNTNMIARKRQVAILKAQGKMAEAIQKLNEYLRKFMTDYESWMELCDLYLCEFDYSNAAFCMEEVIMSNPHNHLFHQKYAEIRYTMGGAENMELARSYFAQAVKLNPNNTRALNGVLLAATNLATAYSKGAKEKQINARYASWAEEQLTVKYKTQATDEQRKETKVLESLRKLLELSQSVGGS
ncbi:ER membrane protein complex subunit 2 [Patella vulgata]|uniref:ER membrane protein complex subunit 2 n=1 Tax=Patella vulgata TaxID=6465 RepID=UPI00217F8AA7|nr:ER membrane protein complex subunit 2 [Patella vulgata]